jgi:predicted transcriptional regulator
MLKLEDLKVIYRDEKENGNFVMIHKDLINDNTLSASAKGIMLYILSKYDDWQFYETEITTHFADGYKGIKKALQELIEKGYITRDKYRNTKGQYVYDYLIYETKHIKEEKEKEEN